MNKLLAAPAAAILIGAMAGFIQDQPTRTSASNNALENLFVMPDNSTFTGAFRKINMEDALSIKKNDITVFAPNNAAFNKMPPDMWSGMQAPEKKGQLMGLLKYHIVKGSWTTAQLRDAVERNNGKFELKAISGQPIRVTREGMTVMLNDEGGYKAALIGDEVMSSNGVIHVIDNVIMPKRLDTHVPGR